MLPDELVADLQPGHAAFRVATQSITVAERTRESAHSAFGSVRRASDL